MHVAVMERAERHGPLVSSLAAHGFRLREGEVVHLDRGTATDRTSLAGDEGEVLFVANPFGDVDGGGCRFFADGLRGCVAAFLARCLACHGPSTLGDQAMEEVDVVVSVAIRQRRGDKPEPVERGAVEIFQRVECLGRHRRRDGASKGGAKGCRVLEALDTRWPAELPDQGAAGVPRREAPP